MPTALAVDWLSIEKAAVAGVPYAKLAEIHEIEPEAIRQRASRYRWAVPARIRAIAREVANLPVAPVTTGERCHVTEHGDRIARVTAETLQDMHARTAAALVSASSRALAAFAEKPAPVTDWQEAATAYKVQRLAAGIDKEGAQVRVNVAMFTDSGVPVVRAEEPEVWDYDPVVTVPVITSAQSVEGEMSE